MLFISQKGTLASHFGQPKTITFGGGVAPALTQMLSAKQTQFKQVAIT
jgi:hypothetical protein